MARIKIEDLPKDMKIGRAELRAIVGGGDTNNMCQTPSGGFIPIPFFTMPTGTSDSDSSTGTDDISKSAGDEAGTAGGVASGTTMGTGTSTGTDRILAGIRVTGGS